MKNKLFLYITIAIMAMGCSSETDTYPIDANISNTGITRISVGTIAETKTATDESSNAVTWQTDDEIAVFNVNGSGRDDYKRFKLSEGAGEVSAYFTGVTADDILIPGETYKLVYPYSSAVSYTGSSNSKSLKVYEVPNTVDNLSTFDWLYSAEKVIPTDGTTPAFTMQHALALIKVTLDVTGFEENDDSDEYLKNVTFATSNSSLVFAQRIYWDTDMNFAVKSYATSTVSYIDGGEYLENTTTTFWLPVFQDSDLGIQDLDITVYMSHGIYTLWSAATTYSTSSVLTPGYVYPIHLSFVVDGSSRSGTLSVEN